MAAQLGLDLMTSNYAGQLTQLARLHGLNYPLVIAAGGDDTVREVLQGFDQAGYFQLPMEQRPVFGILPLGTFNNFARYLGLPLDPQKALECALRGVRHEIDLGRAEGRLFTESVGVGVDVAAWKVFPKESPSVFRRLWDGMIAVIKAVTVFRPKRYVLDIDGRLESLRAYHISVANSRHFSAGIAIAPHAVVDDGHLDLCVIPSLTKLRFILAIPLILLGKHTVYLKGVRYQQVRRVRLWAVRSSTLRIDGHLGPRLPVDIEVLPNCLPMRLPL
jgi:diacylglycerol kinase (ATP)